ncbi:MAG: hypothetical protein FJY82_13520 [Candidatus Aminicenantes bacterium]|nr:hypothetical protein [Candidatus Aminicenantes bacterium]
MNDERARYFREISGAFLRRRGAPFFLSPKDLALVEAWEKEGVPLAAVLEGIDKAFERRPGGTRLRGKILSLAFCQAAVRRSFDQHRERGTGGRRPPAASGLAAKTARAAAAVDEFLALPGGVPEFLKEVFLEARRELAGPAPAGERLESLDERVDALLAGASAPADREAAEREVRLGHGGLPAAERAAAAATLLVKTLRRKFRVPYLSLFYY